MSKTTKTSKNTYEIIATFRAYQEREDITLGYVQSVSEKGAQSLAYKRFDFPRDSFIKIRNLTREAEIAETERKKQERLDNLKRESRLSEEQLKELETSYWEQSAVRVAEKRYRLTERALSDAKHRQDWDKLVEVHPELNAIVDNQILALSLQHLSDMAELSFRMSQKLEQAIECERVGVLDAEEWNGSRYWEYQIRKLEEGEE